MTEVDMRTVFLSPVGSGMWYNSDPGVFHTSRSCAGRGYPFREEAPVKEVYLERAVKEGYSGCGICAKNVEHDFEPANYPPQC